MSLHASASDFPADLAHELTARLQQCDSLIAAHDEQLCHLQDSVAKVQGDRTRALTMRSDIQDVLSALQTAAARAEELRSAYGDAWVQPPRLRVVPSDPPSPQTSLPGESAPQPATDPPVEPEVIILRGGRSLSLMEVISAEPDKDWPVNDVVAQSGETGPDGAHRVRCGLEQLLRKRVLSKSTEKGPVTYRQIAPWRPAR